MQLQLSLIIQLSMERMLLLTIHCPICHHLKVESDLFLVKRKAFLLSVIFLFTFLLIWALATERKKIEVKSIALSTAQISELTKGQLSKPDVLSLVELGLTFEQITQISDIGVSLADIDAAGGVNAFGFTTGG